MKMYSGWQWLLIDAANYMGLDKLLFEERIQWAETNLNQLESLATQAEKPPLFLKAVQAIRKAQQGIPTGHLVGVDACCSGIQIMSALTGCEDGARATGMIDPNVRADAYTSCTDTMDTVLGNHMTVSRADAKSGLMTSFYGSKATPKRIFGEDTPELLAFYEAAQRTAPGAWELLQDLLASWQPYAKEHSWKLPDGFDVRVKVMKKKEARIEIDELDHASFTYEFYENEGTKTGLANVANVTHSVDAYVMRTMHRLCNYDRKMVETAYEELQDSLNWQGDVDVVPIITKEFTYYLAQYQRSTVVDIAILPYITAYNVFELSLEHRNKLVDIIHSMLQHKPFPLVTVHDEFKCHANNVNWVRYHYKNILADIADSNLLDDVMSQIHKTPGTFQKLSSNLGDKIRQSAYALC